jgi:hypothetical protein
MTMVNTGYKVGSTDLASLIDTNVAAALVTPNARLDTIDSRLTTVDSSLVTINGSISTIQKDVLSAGKDVATLKTPIYGIDTTDPRTLQFDGSGLFCSRSNGGQMITGANGVLLHYDDWNQWTHYSPNGSTWFAINLPAKLPEIAITAMSVSNGNLTITTATPHGRKYPDRVCIKGVVGPTELNFRSVPAPTSGNVYYTDNHSSYTVQSVTANTITFTHAALSTAYIGGGVIAEETGWSAGVAAVGNCFFATTRGSSTLWMSHDCVNWFDMGASFPRNSEESYLGQATYGHGMRYCNGKYFYLASNGVYEVHGIEDYSFDDWDTYSWIQGPLSKTLIISYSCNSYTSMYHTETTNKYVLITQMVGAKPYGIMGDSVNPLLPWTNISVPTPITIRITNVTKSTSAVFTAPGHKFLPGDEFHIPTQSSPMGMTQLGYNWYKVVDLIGSDQFTCYSTNPYNGPILNTSTFNAFINTNAAPVMATPYLRNEEFTVFRDKLIYHSSEEENYFYSVDGINWTQQLLDLSSYHAIVGRFSLISDENPGHFGHRKVYNNEDTVFSFASVMYDTVPPSGDYVLLQSQDGINWIITDIKTSGGEYPLCYIPHAKRFVISTDYDKWYWIGKVTESPIFTGSPIAPTAVSGTSTNQIATTKFVQNSITASMPAITYAVATAISSASISGLNVTGSSTLGTVSISNTLAVTNDSSFNDVDINGRFTVYGSISSFQNVTVGGTLDAIGAVDLHSTLNVQATSSLLDTTITGMLTLTGAIKRTTGTSSSYLLQQDGTGRINWYWNTSGGLSPTFLVGAEDASALTISSTNTDGGMFQHRSANGIGKNAGDAIAWTTTVYCDLNKFTYKNSDVITESNFISKAAIVGIKPTLTDGYAVNAALVSAQLNHTHFMQFTQASSIMLPANPAQFDKVKFVDMIGNAATYNVTINGNGKRIMNSASNLIISTNNAVVELTYTTDPYGWVISG